MCGCFGPALGLYLIVSGSTITEKMIGFVILGLSMVGGVAGRLGGPAVRTQTFPFDVFGQTPRPGHRPFEQPRPGPGRTGPGGVGPGRTGSVNPASAAFFHILGMLAKADGRVSQSEINALDPMLPDSSDSERQAAIEAFRAGRDGQVDLDAALAALLPGVNSGGIEGLFDLWCRLSMVDGELSGGETRMLERIERRIFGTNSRTATFTRMYGRRSGQSAGQGGGQSGSRRPPSTPRTEEDPHETFGLPNPTTRAAVKKRYRELVKRHHPDRVRGRGLPDEAVKAAEVQMRKINVARDVLLERYS